ncbi:MAG TPA: flavin reductase family protein [Dehalococcoidia bacterium]|nr:flavin reductase family protein [Dehalococcoidia bacterium]
MDEAAKKTSLRSIPYGLFVMTVKDDKTMTGAAVNWLTQASFAPPLVVLGAKADAPSTGMIESSGMFCINVLETGQVPLASAFFKHVEPNGNKFGDAEFSLSPNGLPVLKDALSFFECKVREKVAIGDHTIFVGEVVEAGVQREGEPLTLAETGFKYGG